MNGSKASISALGAAMRFAPEPDQMAAYLLVHALDRVGVLCFGDAAREKQQI